MHLAALGANLTQGPPTALTPWPHKAETFFWVRI